MSDKMSVDKKDPPKEDSEESMESSPEGEAPAAPPQQQVESQQPKRKGGRKPVRQQSSCGHIPPALSLACPRVGPKIPVSSHVHSGSSWAGTATREYVLIHLADIRDI